MGRVTVQRELLMHLMRAYLEDLPAPFAAARLKAIRDEFDELVFAWNGPVDGSQGTPADVSYRVQGPTVLVEYACQNLGGNPLDHLHSMYRDPTNEYGAGFEE